MTRWEREDRWRKETDSGDYCLWWWGPREADCAPRVWGTQSWVVFPGVRIWNIFPPIPSSHGWRGPNRGLGDTPCGPLNTLWRWGLRSGQSTAGLGHTSLFSVALFGRLFWPVSLSFLSLLKTLISLHQTPITFDFVIPNRIVIFSVSDSFLYLPLSFHFLSEFSHIEYLPPCLYKPPRSPQATITNMGSLPLVCGVWGCGMSPRGLPDTLLIELPHDLLAPFKYLCIITIISTGCTKNMIYKSGSYS